MPELPEVETIKNELSPYLRGKKIQGVVIKRREIIGFPKKRVFKQDLIGRIITDLKRRGKYLILELNDGQRLLFHLRLSGRLFWDKENGGLKYERMRLVLNKGSLSFVEPRMLGRVFLIQREIPRVLRGFQELGPEPLEKGFHHNFLQERLKIRKGKIKSLLLDQRIGCGLGNIYADESLFRAGIHPERRGDTLTAEEIKNLVRAIKSVLREGIRCKGTTLSSYQRPDGKTGGYQERLRVKDREGEPCLVCRTPIQKIKISGRKTNFCPRCQK